MENYDWDQMLSERLRVYEAHTHLPDGFKDRFVRSIRRRRMLRRLRALGLAGITVVAIVAIVGLGGSKPKCDNTQKTFIAASQHTNETTKISGWMLLGYLRECFRRNRTARRKEEE